MDDQELNPTLYGTFVNFMNLRSMALGYLLVLGMGFWANVSANDTGGRLLSTGEIVFTKNNDIIMERESLDISPSIVSVSYQFRNTADKEVNLMIAFPIPEYSLDRISEAPYEGTVIGSELDVRLGQFTVRVDSRSVHYEISAIAKARWRNITPLLKELGVPVWGIEKIVKAIKKLSDADKKRLRRAGAIDKQDWPCWNVNLSYYWQQKFRAHTLTVIEHSYPPIKWGTVGWETNREMFWEYKPYCVSKEDLLARETQRPKPYYNAVKMGYILTTANNWKGPIGNFDVTIDPKNDQFQFDTFTCFGPLIKDSDGKFHMSRKNFSPDIDIKLLLLR